MRLCLSRMSRLVLAGLALHGLAACSEDTPPFNRYTTAGEESLKVIQADEINTLAVGVLFPLNGNALVVQSLTEGVPVSNERSFGDDSRSVASGLDSDFEEIDLDPGGYPLADPGDATTPPEQTEDIDEITTLESDFSSTSSCAVSGTVETTGLLYSTYQINIATLDPETLLRSQLVGRAVRTDCIDTPGIVENSLFQIDFSDNYETGELIYERFPATQRWTSTSVAGFYSQRDFGFYRRYTFNGEEQHSYRFTWTGSALGDGERLLVTTLSPLNYVEGEERPTSGIVRITGGDGTRLDMEVLSNGVMQTFDGIDTFVLWEDLLAP